MPRQNRAFQKERPTVCALAGHGRRAWVQANCSCAFETQHLSVKKNYSANQSMKFTLISSINQRNWKFIKSPPFGNRIKLDWHSPGHPKFLFLVITEKQNVAEFSTRYNSKPQSLTLYSLLKTLCNFRSSSNFPLQRTFPCLYVFPFFCIENQSVHLSRFLFVPSSTSWVSFPRAKYQFKNSSESSVQQL